MSASSPLHRRRRLLPLALGIVMVCSYGLFGSLAATRFPFPYGPWHDNTISQLGNPHLNPNGYVLYLIGCAITGLVAIAFFLSLGAWRATRTPTQRHLLLLVQVLGAAGGFGLVMNAVFPESQYAPHHFFAGLIFNCFAAASLVAIPALWQTGGRNLVLVAFNLAAFATVILMFVFASIHWAEWLPAGMFLLFPLVLGVLTPALEQEPLEKAA